MSIFDCSFRFIVSILACSFLISGVMMIDKESSVSLCELIKPKYHVDISSSSSSSHPRSVPITPQVSQSSDVAKFQRSLSWLIQNYQPSNLSINDDDDDSLPDSSASSSPIGSVKTIDIKQLVGQVDFDLNKLFQSPVKEVESAAPVEPKEKKKLKWRKASKDLLMFRAKASANYDYYSSQPVEVRSDEPIVYGLDEPEEVDWDDGPSYEHLFQDETVSSYYSKKSSKYYNSIFPMCPDRALNFGCVRRKQSNKRMKLKTTVKRNDLAKIIRNYGDNSSCDSLKRLDFSKHSLRKGESRLYVKYNIFAKFENVQSSYVGPKERCKYVYGIKKIDKTRHVAKEVVKTNKKLFKLEGGVRRDAKAPRAPADNRPDPTSVIQHSLDRNLVNQEINQTYDDLYVEFLISIQHREITPEDYEYLTRLDELVKKKTVNESVLGKLKVEKVSAELLAQLEKDQEVCGICLDPYQLDQSLKHLPCGHKFHSDCIDSWLKSQSNICPLDKKPVDESATTPAPAAAPAGLGHQVSRLTTQQSWMIGLDQAEIDFLMGASAEVAPAELECTDQEVILDIINTLIFHIEKNES